MKLEESAFGSSDENKLGQIQYKWHINSTALYKVILFVCVCVKEGDLWILCAGSYHRVGTTVLQRVIVQKYL